MEAGARGARTTAHPHPPTYAELSRVRVSPAEQREVSEQQLAVLQARIPAWLLLRGCRTAFDSLHRHHHPCCSDLIGGCCHDEGVLQDPELSRCYCAMAQASQ